MNKKKSRVVTKKIWRFKSCKKAQNLRHRAYGKKTVPGTDYHTAGKKLSFRLSLNLCTLA
jgi:hypothetical protein